jgi:hypothetical protein
MKALRSCLPVTVALLSTASAADAQDCAAFSQVGRCSFAIRAAEASLTGVALAAAGGNPWIGSASTLGYRVPGAPRFAAQARMLFTRVDLPGQDISSAEGGTLVGIGAGFSIGIIEGISPAPTVGGLGSLDLVGELGTVVLPDGFETGSPIHWSLGARVGILRESFTLPGITASVAYRRVGEMTFDDSDQRRRAAHFHWPDASLWSVRAVTGKRILGFGLAGGLGWDASSADAEVTFPGAADEPLTAESDIDADNYLAFVDVSWTSLILSLSAEAGRQFGGDGDMGAGDDLTSGNRWFGGLSARLTF